MPEDNIQMIRQKIKDLRKQLSDLEIDRIKAEPDLGSDFWETFMNLTLEIDRFEHAMIRINLETVSDINQLREHISTSMSEYNHWREKMREMEKLFMLNILRPGYILKQAIRQRKYLEAEYARIRTGIVNREYDSLHEVEADIRQVLVHGENAFEADQRSFTDEQVQEAHLRGLAEDLDPQVVVEMYNEDQILQDFKRVVLPAIHPDTSDTPKETFLTIFEAYETEDYLLMEAYVAQYRGKFEVDDKQDPLALQETLTEFQKDYHRLAGRLDRRLKALKQELTPEELEDDEKLQAHLNSQREELQRLIKGETEKVFDLREKIEGLIQLYLQIQSENDHE